MSCADEYFDFDELSDNEIRNIEADIYDIEYKLCIYINSGYIAGAALSELCGDADLNSASGRLLRYLKNKAEKENTSLESEFFDAAKKLKSRILLRFAMLLSDNKKKGSLLTDKLEAERKQAQNEKMNFAKEMAGRAEAKLCVPLMLLLIALVTIAVSPALLNL